MNSLAAPTSQADRFRRYGARPSGFGWLAIAAVFLPLCGFAGAAWTAWQGVEAEARARLVRTVDMLHEHALGAFETQEAILTAIEGRIRGLDWPTIATDVDLHRFLRDLAQDAPSTAGTALIGPDGRLAAASRVAPPAPPVDLSGRDYVRAHRGADRADGPSFVGEVVVSQPSGVVVFTLSRPRRGEDGRPDGGVLVATFFPERFARFYESITESDGDGIALLRPDGAVLVRAPAPPGPLPLRVSPDLPLLRAFAEAPSGRGMLRAAGAFDGVDRLIAFRRVGNYPVLVAYGLDRAVLWREWRRRLAIPGVVALVAAALLLWLTARTEAVARMGREEAERRADAETARAAAEAQLRHAERVNALGLLAAGVAHDFGNALQSIGAGARLLDAHAEEPPKVRRYAALIAEAAARGGTLTTRMRNFARRNAPDNDGATPPLEPVSAILGACELLERSLTGRHRLRCVLPPTLPTLQGVDRTEFEAALVNLAVNARDAMPLGGEVTVTATVAAAPPPPLPAGPYLCLAVADTGVGMDAATLARAGEAFFTTKGPGEGTGLGLSMARGFAERAGGTLAIASAPGQGTTVTLWLPATPPD